MKEITNQRQRNESKNRNLRMTEAKYSSEEGKKGEKSLPSTKPFILNQEEFEKFLAKTISLSCHNLKLIVCF